MCLKRHTKSQISQRMAKMKIYGHRERHSFTSGRWFSFMNHFV